MAGTQGRDLKGDRSEGREGTPLQWLALHGLFSPFSYTTHGNLQKGGTAHSGTSHINH